jgi:hypothetical protein
MSDEPTDEVDYVGAVVWLECKRHHRIGRLLMNRGWREVVYAPTDYARQPERWPLSRHDLFSEPVCPGGCGFEVGAPADVLVQRVLTLAKNPNGDEETFTLTDIRPG